MSETIDDVAYPGATYGETQRDLTKNGVNFDSYRIKFNDLEPGRVEGDTEGFVKVLKPTSGDEIHGTTIVAHDVGEQIAAFCLAMSHGIGLNGLGKAVLPYPTRAEYLCRLADAYKRTRLTPTTKSIMARWFRWSV